MTALGFGPTTRWTKVLPLNHSAIGWLAGRFSGPIRLLRGSPDRPGRLATLPRMPTPLGAHWGIGSSLSWLSWFCIVTRSLSGLVSDASPQHLFLFFVRNYSDGGKANVSSIFDAANCVGFCWRTMCSCEDMGLKRSRPTRSGQDGSIWR